MLLLILLGLRCTENPNGTRRSMMPRQKQNNYGLRSHVKLALLRYKKVIGPDMKARKLPQQKTAGHY